MKPTLDMIHRRYGYLVVTGCAGHTRDRKGKKKALMWRCLCNCGEIVEIRGDHLRAGKIKACGKNGHHWRPTRKPLDTLSPVV